MSLDTLLPQCPRKIAQFTLSSMQEITVSYFDADPGSRQISHEGMEDVPTILFISGAGGLLEFPPQMYELARTRKVRILSIDRFGYGYTTRLPIHQWISAWLQIVPLLLRSIGIKHIALVSHSSGVIYLLNTLCYQRELLSPRRPYVSMLAPWVNPRHSGLLVMRALQLLPFTLLLRRRNVDDIDDISAASRLAQDHSGNNANLLQTRHKITAKDEILFCLKKGVFGPWGICEDCFAYAETLSACEDRLGNIMQFPLRIDLWFAEKDPIVGNKGQQYMESCWRGRGYKLRSRTSKACHSCIPIDRKVLRSLVCRIKGTEYSTC